MPPQVQSSSLVASNNAPLAGAIPSPLWMADQVQASSPHLVRRKGGSGGGGGSSGGGDSSGGGGSTPGTGTGDGSGTSPKPGGGGGSSGNTTSVATTKQVKISLLVVALTVLPVIIDSI
ncbi:hypothetical protein BGZ76_005336 [Entomortierella beljakovae]|nr:hypothetical protein BGZ76_005336 [Entomortierella beljakovae]